MKHNNPFVHLYLWGCVALAAVGAVDADTWWAYGFVALVALAMAWFTWDVFMKRKETTRRLH